MPVCYFMHCNGIVHFYDNSRAWKESMVVETLCYWAVPVFFMITGATLWNTVTDTIRALILRREF